MLGSLTPVEHIDVKEYGRVLATNLLAPQGLLAVFDRCSARRSALTFLASRPPSGIEPRAFWGAYGSSKAALENLLGAYATRRSIPAASECTS
jgi:NAD(P)-dependent dehydrogenase (short-subunit alcohol dehydrogenase family)